MNDVLRQRILKAGADQEVKMNFAFGCAQRLYERRIHPRVVISPDDIPILKERIKSGVGRKLMGGLRRKVAPLVAKVAAADLRKESARKPDLSFIIANIFDLALVGLLDHSRAAIAAAKQALLAVPAAFSAADASPGAAVYSIMYGCHPLAYDLLYDHLSAGERAAYADWIVNVCVRPAIRAARPLYYQRAGANTPICETLPALLGLLAVMGDPGVPDLTAERDELIAFLRASLHAAFSVNGYPQEDIGYGTAVAAGLAQIVEPLRRAGFYDAYRDCPRYARIGNAILHFIQPWGRYLTNTGDHSDCFICRELILARQAAENHSPALAWLLGALTYPTYVRKVDTQTHPTFGEVLLRKGFRVPATALALVVQEEFKHAVHPAQANIPMHFCDQDRGIVSMRSGWGEDDTFVVFDGSQRSPAAQGHEHASCGHFDISALGEYFAVDSGRYNMEQNCHNVVLIDGKSGRSTGGEWKFVKHAGVLKSFVPAEFVDTATVDSSLQHNCYWARRTLGLVKGKGVPAYVWTVDDINKANDGAEFWWQLHTSPENRIRIRGRSASIRGWRKGNWLDVNFVLPAPKSFPKPHRLSLRQDEVSCSSSKYIPDPERNVQEHIRPADMLHMSLFIRPRLIARVDRYNGRFMAIMLPRRKAEKPAQVERLPSIKNSLAARITFPAVEDLLIFAYEHNLLEAADIKGCGQWCLVRRSRKTGRVLEYALGHGTHLAVAGKALRVSN